jgi:plastocyanin
MRNPTPLGGATCALLLALLAFPADAGAQTGSIDGRVQLPTAAPRRTASRYPGAVPSTRTAQEIPAVVYIQGPVPGSSATAPANPTLAQSDTTFAPNVLIVPVNTTVQFPNRDPFFHNVFSYSSTERFDLGRYPRGESKTVTFDEPGVVKVYCEVHESMRAAVVVVQNPFNAVVSRDGTFRLTNVPAGRHTLVVWHHDGGVREIAVDVRAGAATSVNVRY